MFYITYYIDIDILYYYLIEYNSTLMINIIIVTYFIHNNIIFVVNEIRIQVYYNIILCESNKNKNI